MSAPTDDSQTAGDGGINTSAHAIVHDKSKGYIIGTILALSILTNVSCFWVINDHGKEHRLQQYDLDWFKSSEYAPLKAKVEMQGELIKMLQIRKECLKP